MDARELNSHVRYTGMEVDARAILLKDNLATAEDVAMMTSLDVFDRLLEKYEVVMCESERILLIDTITCKNFRNGYTEAFNPERDARFRPAGNG